jgi:uncharacterized membrane protein YphA (DoxX/SURF4 family)
MAHPTGAEHPRVDALVRPQIDRRSFRFFRGRKRPRLEADLRPKRASRRETRSIAEAYGRFEQRVVDWMAAHGIALLRVSLGIVFFWFGALKFVPGASPAEGLASETVARLSFGLVDPKVALVVLAAWETGIGLLLVLGRHLRLALGLLLLQMAGTLTPLVLFPSLTFARFPFEPTMEGQYILKNLVLISAAIAIGATLRGGRLVARPRVGCCCTGESCGQTAA